jgi:hypothetical protein
MHIPIDQFWLSSDENGYTVTLPASMVKSNKHNYFKKPLHFATLDQACHDLLSRNLQASTAVTLKELWKDLREIRIELKQMIKREK